MGASTQSPEVAAPRCHLLPHTKAHGSQQPQAATCWVRVTARPGTEAGFRTGPCSLARDQRQWPLLASLLMPGWKEAFLVICPIPFGHALCPRPGLGLNLSG